MFDKLSVLARLLLAASRDAIVPVFARGRGLVRVADALLSCWAILAVPAVLAGLAAGTEQGRDALNAAASISALLTHGPHAFMAQSVMTVLAILTALTVLAPRGGGTPPKRYAAHFVPGLVGLIVGFLPSFVLQEFGPQSPTARNDASFFVAIGTLVPMLWVVVARDLLARGRKELGEDALAPILLGVWAALVFIFVERVLWAFVLNAAALAFADAFTWRQAAGELRKWQRGAAICIALFAVAGGLAVAWDPSYWGMRLGTYATAIVALNFWLGIGCLIGLAVRPWGNRVVATVVVVALIVLFATGPFDLRDVRLLPGAPPAPADSLEAHAAAWLEARRESIAASARYPVFIVNADGGGVRAAWWTASLLGAMQDLAPSFAGRVFAISGVSGGSLGASVFAARTAEAPAAGSRCSEAKWQSCAGLVLGQDLLAPAAAAMLVTDVGRSILRNNRLSDRAAALEQAFEASWHAATGRNTFAGALGGLWAGENATKVPLLLLNATEATSGRRLVLAPVVLPPGDGERGDVRALLQDRGVRLSTAVLLSARFPAVSPAGWLPASGGSQRGTALVDGGYADNSGALSAMEAVTALQAAATKLRMTNVVPVALMIANDPVSLNPQPQVIGAAKRSGFSATTFGSLIAPVATLDRLRQAGALRAKRAYAAQLRDTGGVVLDRFDLRESDVTFPLGWMLAGRTRRAMTDQIAAMVADPKSDLMQAVTLASAP